MLKRKIAEIPYSLLLCKYPLEVFFVECRRTYIPKTLERDETS